MLMQNTWHIHTMKLKENKDVEKGIDKGKRSVHTKREVGQTNWQSLLQNVYEKRSIC